MKRFGLVVFCGVMSLSGAVWAAQTIDLHPRTAGELAGLCAADPGSPAADAKINYCHGFAQGVVDDRMSIVEAKKPFCFPSPTPKRAATMREFVAWVRANPSNRDISAREGIVKFFGERFPCK